MKLQFVENLGTDFTDSVHYYQIIAVFIKVTILQFLFFSIKVDNHNEQRKAVMNKEKCVFVINICCRQLIIVEVCVPARLRLASNIHQKVSF